MDVDGPRPAPRDTGRRDRRHRRALRREAKRERAGPWAERMGLRLSEDIEALLAGLDRGEPQPGRDGALHEIDQRTRISRDLGQLLYHLVLERRPARTLEVGLAYGCSTVFLLAALREAGQGQHLAIDPFQSSQWLGIGAQRARQLGVEERFTLIEETAERALPRLAEEGMRVQLALIDGDHRFESVLMDFTLVDRLCEAGSVVVLDDLWLPSVRCALRFVETNRTDWRRRPSPARDTCILERVGEDRRAWDHFAPF
jgi:predicted O-methyltransferase YrrM